MFARECWLWWDSSWLNSLTSRSQSRISLPGDCDYHLGATSGQNLLSDRHLPGAGDLWDSRIIPIICPDLQKLTDWHYALLTSNPHHPRPLLITILLLDSMNCWWQAQDTANGRSLSFYDSSETWPTAQLLNDTNCGQSVNKYLEFWQFMYSFHWLILQLTYTYIQSNNTNNFNHCIPIVAAMMDKLL